MKTLIIIIACLFITSGLYLDAECVEGVDEYCAARVEVLSDG